MHSIILAGGRGTRLAPYTTVLPKPLMPVGDRPILEIILLQQRHAGLTKVTVAVGYLGSLIEAYFGDGKRLGLDIEYSREDEPLGTAGPIALVKGIQDDFLVMNGDVLTNLDYSALLRDHRETGAVATIATYLKEVKLSLGVLQLGQDRRVSGYEEKPTLQYRVSMGIYAFSPRVLAFIERGERVDLPELVRRLIAAGQLVRAYPFTEHWLDMGNKDDFERSIELFSRHKAAFLPEAAAPGGGAGGDEPRGGRCESP